MNVPVPASQTKVYQYYDFTIVYAIGNFAISRTD
jgi:hypothetical protein